MDYVRAWDTSKAEDYENFQKTIHGSEHCAQVPIADVSRGIEHLLSVVCEYFDKAHTKLAWTPRERWSNFEQYMHDNYLEF